MQGIDAQIRAQYSQGSAFLPRDVRIFFRISLPNLLLAAPATRDAWLKQVCAAREHQSHSEIEGINKNVNPLLLGLKIDDDLRIASPKSQFVFKAESGTVWVDHLLPALASLRQLSIFTCYMFAPWWMSSLGIHDPFVLLR
jgi:hypothetical protein